ncbi:MAG: sulfite exporter TauE/SafE family protein [Deltaproteobacteria bacterium]|nr:sulfite exporter TauE/SafE family protein [Deltaproteobacteria bacterium]
MHGLEIEWFIYPVFFLIALLYSSVGHGGASGYLAVFSIAGKVGREFSTIVFFLNILVSGISFFNFRRSGFFSARTLLPFIITSVPAAFVGGWLELSLPLITALTGFALLAAGVRLLFAGNGLKPSFNVGNRFAASLAAGAVIGLLSGITGIGGGIYLTPFLIFSGWEDAKRAAAVSSGFIVLNSISGLLARSFSAEIAWQSIAILSLVVVSGGICGSMLGTRKISPELLKRLLGAVLLIASFKMFYGLV